MIQIKAAAVSSGLIVSLDQKEQAMSLTSALMIAAIVLAFAIFAGALAWADYRTSHLGDLT